MWPYFGRKGDDNRNPKYIISHKVVIFIPDLGLDHGILKHYISPGKPHFTGLLRRIRPKNTTWHYHASISINSNMWGSCQWLVVVQWFLLVTNSISSTIYTSYWRFGLILAEKGDDSGNPKYIISPKVVRLKPWSHQAYVRRAGCLRAVYGRKPWRSQDHLAGASRSWPQP